MSTRRTHFGQALRTARIAAGLSQESLAERSGLSVRGISDLERGARAAPRAESIRLLADALGLDGPDRLALIASARPADDPPPALAVQPSRPILTVPAAGRPPAPMTPLVGRETELARIAALLREDHRRIVTLTGPGGVGKTRLATAVAAIVGREFTDGIAFVDLSSISDAEGVMGAVAAAIGAPDSHAGTLDAAIAARLAERALLLVLDNCEQVLHGVARVAGLLTAAPGLKVLATSRERLHLRGEREVPIPPLAVPPARGIGESPLAAADVMAAPAVRLFLTLADDAAPDLTLAGPDIDAIADVCRALDGLPLAYEIAAPMLRYFSPSALAARLDERLLGLDDGPLDLPVRQRTVEAAVSWSYDLLAPQDGALFDRLAVFAGGWDLAAAVGISQESGGETGVFGTLATLVDRHLVQQRPDATGEPRYRMLETIRACAFEKLARSGGGEAARVAHAHYYQALVNRLVADASTPAEATAVRRFAPELPNVRTALAWALEREQVEIAMDLAIGFAVLGARVATYAEADDWIAKTLDLVGDPRTSEAVRLLDGAAWIAHRRGDLGRSRDTAQRGLALADELGSLPGRLGHLVLIGSAQARMGDVETAQTNLLEALALAEQLGDAGKAAIVLSDLVILTAANDLPLALSYGEAAIARGRGAAPQSRLLSMLTNFGVVNLSLGDFAAAEAAFVEGLAIAREMGTPAALVMPISNLAALPTVQADIPRASAYFAEALRIYFDLGDDPAVAETLDDLAGFVAARRPVDAAYFLGNAKGLRDRVGAPRHPSFAVLTEAATATAKAGTDEPAFRRAWESGYAATSGVAVGRALGLLEADASTAAADAFAGANGPRR